jgi:hypothetical protein
MRTMLARYQATLWILALATSSGVSALAGIEATATKSLTIQSAGPRQGEAGSRYFNVEGLKNERYASFGVLVFELPKAGGSSGRCQEDEPPAGPEHPKIREGREGAVLSRRAA